VDTQVMITTRWTAWNIVNSTQPNTHRQPINQKIKALRPSVRASWRTCLWRASLSNRDY